MIYVIFGVIMAIYGLACFYIGLNGWLWLKETFSFKFKKVYIIFILFISLNIFLERFVSSKILAYLSGIWMVIILYGILLLPIVNLILYFTKRKGTKLSGWIVVGIFLFVFTYGSYNTWRPTVVTYEIEIDKQSSIEDLNLMLVTDLHLGEIVGDNHLKRLVAVVDERRPDIVVIAGDIIDDFIEPFIKENMGETMGKIEAPLGVYGISGNHDYYGNDLEILFAEMMKSGVRMLADEAVLIEESFYLVGRNDATDKNRQSIEHLIHELDKSKPIIMLDHQPTALEEALHNGVDIILSGHTHRGQLIPANLITSALFENDYGYLQKETLHSFVSSGFGIWGPPFRIGSRSEVMEIIIHFQPLEIE